VPKEGTSLSSDDLVVPKDAKQAALAHAFINFLHDPRVAAENSNFISYLCPNKPSYAFLDKELKENPALFLPADLKAKCEVIEDLEGDNAKYTKIWDEIKAAK
jgi:spermidine/putrescine-binding protein